MTSTDDTDRPDKDGVCRFEGTVTGIMPVAQMLRSGIALESADVPPWFSEPREPYTRRTVTRMLPISDSEPGIQPRRYVSDEQLDRWFRLNRPGSDDVIAAHEEIRAAFRHVADVMQRRLPECPDKTATFRELWRVSMSANGTIACNHPDNARTIKP